jgi:hypothetical protein
VKLAGLRAVAPDSLKVVRFIHRLCEFAGRRTGISGEDNATLAPQPKGIQVLTQGSEISPGLPKEMSELDGPCGQGGTCT